MKNNSVQARKQRKALYSAALHQQQKFMHVHLSPELRKKHGRRNVQLRKGDKVKILRGNFKKKEAAIEKIDLKRGKIYLTGIETIKKDGSKVAYPLKASNLMIITLDLSDKKRKAKLEGKKEVKAKEVKSEQKKTKVEEAAKPAEKSA